MSTLMQSEVPGATLFRRGKVRDVYEAGGDRLVIVASDRLSAFDVVLPTPIPDKGRVLTELSSFWFDRTERVVPNHLVSTNIDDMPAVFREVPELDGRAVLVKRCERIDIECVARGYISGSAWTEYKALGTVASETLPKDLAGVAAARRADVHSRDESGERPRREHLARAAVVDGRQRAREAARGSDARALPARHIRTRSAAG